MTKASKNSSIQLKERQSLIPGENLNINKDSKISEKEVFSVQYSNI